MAFMATLQFGGPSLGGVLADGVGLTAAFATEVLMLAVAALLFGQIATDRPVPSGKTVRHDLIEACATSGEVRHCSGSWRSERFPACS
jgi:hypothetical protein